MIKHQWDKHFLLVPLMFIGFNGTVCLSILQFFCLKIEFHVKLWNLNCGDGIIGEITPDGKPLIEEFVKGNGEVAVKEFVKDSSKFAKEFVKAGRQIYKLISQNPQINAVQMAENMGLSARQVQKYLKRLQEMGKITREGGRKIGRWKLIDEEYEGFFERI